MRLIWLLIFYSIVQPSFSQHFEVFGGPMLNNYHDFNYLGESESGYGVITGIGFEKIKLFKANMMFALTFEHYKGSVDYENTSKYYGYIYKGDVSKSVLSLGIYPFNPTLTKRLVLNFGMEGSFLLDDFYTGSTYEYQVNGPWGGGTSTTDAPNHISSFYTLGLKGRAAYDFLVLKNKSVSVQYGFYYGLTNEFAPFPTDVLSMRHSLCLGIDVFKNY